MILELLSVVAPVFIVALIGLAWARSGTHFDEASITRLVLNVGIPCLVFRSLTSLDVPPAELARMAGLAAAVMSMFAVAGFIVLKAMKLPAHTYLGPLVFANSGNIGLPICLFAFGDAGLALGMAYFAVSSTCHVVLGGPLFAGSFSLRPFFRSPLTWAVIITVGVVASSVTVPTWITRTTTLLGDIAIPLMLLTLGVSLSQDAPGVLGPLGHSLDRPPRPRRVRRLAPHDAPRGGGSHAQGSRSASIDAGRRIELPLRTTIREKPGAGRELGTGKHVDFDRIDPSTACLVVTVCATKSPGERLATGVLAIGARSAVSISRHTTSLPPNRCAAHPDPFSSVDVDVRTGVSDAAGATHSIVGHCLDG